MDPFTLTLNLLPLLGRLFGSQGQKDKPDLKDEEGNWLPLHYMQHARAEAGDLDSVYKDGHTICHNDTGVPVGRWSPSLKEIQPVTGFTIQGLPVYEAVPVQHPVWTTKREVPSHLGTPGSEGMTSAFNGGNFHPVPNPVQYRRGERLAAYLGNYGPLDAPRSVPPSTGSGEPLAGSLGIAGVMLAGAAILAASGHLLAAGIVAAAGVRGLKASLKGGGSSGGGVASGPSGTRGTAPGGSIGRGSSRG